jgi:probable HAF family extracellular repeat protein
LINPNLGLTLVGAEAINNKGQIAGFCTTASGESRVFLYEDGAVDDWSVPGAYSIGSLNKNGQMVGNYFTPDGNTHGFLLSNGSMTEITVPKSVTTGCGGINSSGVLSGGYSMADKEPHAFLYNNGVYTTLRGDVKSGASDINDRGQVVGWYGNSSAYLYDNGNFTDLNTLIDPSLGIKIDDALFINNKGQIVTYANYRGEGRVFLLTPIPEPPTISLLIIGFIGFSTYRKFNKRAA